VERRTGTEPTHLARASRHPCIGCNQKVDRDPKATVEHKVCDAAEQSLGNGLALRERPVTPR